MVQVHVNVIKNIWVAKLCFAEMKHSNWLRLITWIVTPNESAYFSICLWHWLQGTTWNVWILTFKSLLYALDYLGKGKVLLATGFGRQVSFQSEIWKNYLVGMVVVYCDITEEVDRVKRTPHSPRVTFNDKKVCRLSVAICFAKIG